MCWTPGALYPDVVKGVETAPPRCDSHEQVPMCDVAAGMLLEKSEGSVIEALCQEWRCYGRFREEMLRGACDARTCAGIHFQL